MSDDASCLLFRSKLSLFQSRSSLQRASVKVRHLYIQIKSALHVVMFEASVSSVNFTFQLKAKRSECNSKATHARNDYLLTLAAANAHQQRYYDTDLIDSIKVRTCTLDGGR